MRTDAEALADPAVRERVIRWCESHAGAMTRELLYTPQIERFGVQHQPIVQGRPIESLSKGYPLVSNGIAAAIIVYHLEAALLEHTWIELSSDVKRPDGPWCAVFGGASNGLCRYGPSRLEALLAACESITDA